MKSASQIVLSRAWWKKEAPQGLKKSAPGFERALDDYARAEDGLSRGTSAAAVKTMEKAIEALEAAAKLVATEAKDLVRTTKDKAAVTDLENTILVMAKPLQRELSTTRSGLTGLEDEEEDTGPFGGLADHGKFFMKWVPKLKAGVVPFAFGLIGDGPGDARFNFHMSKEPRALGMALKTKADAKRFTFGRAGTSALTESLGTEEEAGRTLALNLEGKPIKGLAKRAKKLLRELGMSAFSKVVVLEGGVLLEAADDATMDLPDDAEGASPEGNPMAAPAAAPAAAPVAAPVAATSAAPAPADAAAPPAPPAAPAPGDDPSQIPDAKAQLARYAAAMTKLKGMDLTPAEKSRIAELQKMFTTLLKAGDLAGAESILFKFEDRADGIANALDASLVPNDAEHRDAVAADLGLTPEDVAKLEDWIAKNAMAEVGAGPMGVGTDEVGGTRLAEALAGTTPLGPLTEAQQTFLAARVMRKWLYMPRQDEDGGAENITDFTTAVGKNPDLAPKMARLMMLTYDQNNQFAGSKYDDKAMQERDLSMLLVENAIDLDPTFMTQALTDRIGAKGMAEWAMGDRLKATHTELGPSLKDLKEDPYLKEISPERKAKILAAASTPGVMTDADSDTTVSYMFNASGVKDVENPAQQAAWAKTLSGSLGRSNCLAEGPTAAAEGEIGKVLGTENGRALFFGDKVPGPLRNWAVSHMAGNPADPFKKVWTADDLKNGWESDVVGQAMAGEALALANKQFPKPMAFDLSKDKGSLANMLGQSLGLPASNLPGKDETPEQRKAREAAGINHPYYKTDEGPLKTPFEQLDELQAAGKLGTEGVKVTPIPVTWASNEHGTSIFKVMRIETTDGPIFFDHNGNRFTSAGHWETDNKLPDGRVSYPKGLELGGAVVTTDTPAASTGSKVMGVLDKVVMGVGIVAGVVAIAATGGLATPAVGAIALGVGAGAGVYGATRAGQGLHEKSELGHDVADLADPEIRAMWLDLGSNALSVGAIGGGMKAAKLLQQGSKMSRVGANVVAGMSVASSVTDGLAMADTVNTLSKNWDKMTPEQKAEAMLSLSFTAGMGAMAAKAGGGKFGDSFDFKRTRNQLETGTPFDLAPNSKLKQGEVAVLYDGGKDGVPPSNFRIGYGGDKPPSREMIELHGRAAAAMEASVGLKAKFMELVGGPSGAPKGSAAWEAGFELDKIGAEARMVLDKLNAGAQGDEAAKLRSRLDELNGALIDERGRLDEWLKTGESAAGKGQVGAPSGGDTQRLAKGWPEAPKDHHWVAGPGGTPFLRRTDSTSGSRLYYDDSRKMFVLNSDRPDMGMTTVGHGENELAFMPREDGKTAEAHAVLRKFHSGAERSAEELAAQKKVGGLGVDGDDAGHMVGHRFGLDQGMENLFPQELNFNRGAYKTMENEFADWIEAGGEVRMSVTLDKFKGERPDKVTVRYSVVDPKTGREVYANDVRFSNDGKQTFDRIEKGDMGSMFAKTGTE